MANELTMPAVPPGLKGVAVADTALGAVRGSEGFYHYRQHDAASLAVSRSLEAIWYLMLFGRLPDPGEERDFAQRIGRARDLDDEILQAAADMGSRIAAPHLALMASLPLLAPDGISWLDQRADAFTDRLIGLAAGIPTLLGAILAGHDGRAPQPADPDLGHAADWVRLATGATPVSEAARMVEVYLSLTVDHGFNASTFASRVTASAGADAVACMSSGIGTLSGPLHGGAPRRALEMIDEIGDPANTEAWIRDRLAAGQKIMGFGHAVYRAGDPRSNVLRGIAVETGGALVERAVEIEAKALAELERHKPDAVIVTNVEFYAGVVMALAGLPPHAFTPSFTVSRAMGWSAHIQEQVVGNKIFRPSARYIGPDPTPG